MIKNFETIKKQLGELSEVINSFKSEAVQLRIIELVLGLPSNEESGSEPTSEVNDRSSKKRKAKKKTKAKETDAAPNTRKKVAQAGTGAVATLSQLAKTDFFAKPKTISDIISHCSTNLARNFKANDFSGKLARMIRNDELTRSKNTENQYEYTKA